MGNSKTVRLQEGALSALKTPSSPPDAPKLVPLKPVTASKEGQ
jgi:hypothetical protein